MSDQVRASVVEANGAAAGPNGHMRNLDLLAASTAQQMVNKPDIDPGKLDTLVTRALAVLQADGIYAGLLYLYSRTNQQELPVAKAIREPLLRMLDTEELKPLSRRTDGTNLGNWASVSSFLLKENGLLADLDDLLLVKDLFEKTMIYARYSAKAAEAEAKARQDAREHRARNEPANDAAAADGGGR